MSENYIDEKSVYLMPAFVDIVSFSQSYNDYHGWLTSVVCSLGIIFNLVIVLAMNKNKSNFIIFIFWVTFSERI